MARTEIIKLRVTEEEKADVERRAAPSSVSDFVRGLLWPGKVAGPVSDSDRDAWIAERVAALRKQHPPALARKLANEEWEGRG